MTTDPHIFFQEHMAGGRSDPADVRTLLRMLWDNYGRRVFLHAAAKLRNTEDARDVCQDVFVRAAKWLQDNPGQMPAKVNFPAWLLRTARNLIIDRFRRPALEVQWAATDTSPETHWPDDKAADPAEQTDTREQIEALRQCIETLPDRRRKILKLRHIEGMACSAVATELGVSAGTVSVILHRARNQLRECVELRLVR